ncbi:hypothetical protein KUW17_17285 [Leisingera aquaemixtae]|uniref:CBU_0592 family membrane protein n=1 Tax=Leisingera TaxID=191028 RepID=UPI001C96614B|nr:MULTISPECIES: hypothetical protein [Leisingera]MBY6068503.1 hypothetical protein [Leisingera aquaemixtae]MCB4458156.1 hypothetical protein [Leisingera sp. McT4-56]
MAEITWFDALGLAGSVIIVAAYYLATRGALPADRIPFNAANIAGGALVMLSLVYRPNLGAIVIEVMFLLIAVLAILRNLRARA